ncbi:MAG: hypothetical protein KDD62_07690, partial [Bdellovibrionales bacterium]|nr:hypothetical protein [Bdellovibrionales bacterium]
MDGSIRQIISSLGANATESARSFLDARRLTDSIDLIREAKNNGQITPGLQLVEAECFLEIRKYHEALKCVSEEESAFAISQESSALRAKIETIRERNEHVNRPEHTELVSRIMNSLTA